MTLRLGIDLGGTKIEVGALDAEGALVLRRRRPTPRHDYVALLHTITELVHEAEQALGTRGSVGVGIPGALSRVSGRVKNANSTWLNDRPLQQDLEALLARPVRLANDANCFALSEAVDGAAAGERVVFGVILGTGTGGGIVIDGAPLAGRNAIAGEWGHNPLPWPTPEEQPGPTCWCGKQGCIETWLCGPALATDHQRVTGQTASAEAIAAAAVQGDAQAEATLQRYEARLARALAGVINTLDPDAIVLGGGLSNLDRLYTQVPSLWGQWVFSDQCDTPLLRHRHGDSSGVRGAAWLWPA